jgi:hypothetical protein
MNIVPGLHSALVSIPKLADTGYTNDNTTAIAASNPHILESEQCQHTGPNNPNLHHLDKQHETLKTINFIFDLPSSCKTFLWYHASVRFSPKETIIDAIHSQNYTTWLKLMVILINRYFPNSDKTDKTVKGT